MKEQDNTVTTYTSIGQARPLIDGQAKVTGAAQFAPDVHLPGVLHARLVTSSHAHANVRAIHTAQALTVPGVVAVLTAPDLPDVPPTERKRLMLARGRVMFVGQPVALVLATSEAAAEDGVEQVFVEYEPLPAAVTMDEALAEAAPLVWPDGMPGGSGDTGGHGASGGQVPETRHNNIVNQTRYTRGDLAAGFAEAEMVIERTYTTPTVHQSSIETQGVIVQPDPLTGGLTIWTSTQSPFDVRTDVAEVLGMSEADIRVIAMTIGGGFGAKIVLYEPLVALAARTVNRPVRLVLTRLEELLATNPAPAMRIRARLGAKRDGTLTALEGEVWADNGCYPFELAGFVARMFGSFYRIPNFSLTGTDVLTFKMSASAYRAPGATSVIFALDCLLDELAQRLNLDPIEIRLKNSARPGDLMANDSPWPGMGMREVLEALQEHPAWKYREQARAAGRGVGVAVGGWSGGVEPAAALCALNRDGRLQIHIGSVDVSGTMTGFSLMAAEAFGVPPEDVRVIFSDTDTAPYAGMSAGSKVTFTTGAAVVQAAREARQQLLAIAAEEFEAAVEDLEIVDRKVQVRGVPSKAIKLSDVAAMTMGFDERYAPIIAHGRHVENTSAPAFSAQLAEVEVDRETGEVHLRRLVAIQDVGRAINPLAIQGQMHGGATQGVGWALYEQMIFDQQGQLLSGSWMDYALPHITQTPPVFETIIIEVPSDNGPFGVRGVGEAPVIPTAAAIANAIADATGARVTDLPMTAPRVLAALSQLHQGIS
jgi:CO/xanthine dehydrogenase Mo-binding subunit